MSKYETKGGFKHKLLATSILAVLIGGMTAQAQDVERVAEDDESVQQTVVITGSRLSQANITSSSPVTTVDAQAFAIRGTVDVAELVNTLPGVFAGQTNNVGNGATGTSTLNLRGLGATRTLVLANGKRLPPGSPTSFASDLNLIPSALVERVEIVTGGASAVYGSDAIGGVANFILRDDFEGAEFDFLYGFNQTNNNDSVAQLALENFPGENPISGGLTDNPTFDFSAIIGANLDNGKGNVTAYFRFLSQDGVLQNNRDFSRCNLNFRAGDATFCGGSNAGPFPSTFNVPNSDAAGNPLPAGTPFGTFSLEAGNVLQQNGSNPFNFNPLNPLVRPTERFNAGFSGHYQIHDKVETYIDFGFTQNTTDSQIAPSASFGGAADTFGCDNPFLSAEQVQIFCTNRGFSGSDIVTVGISRRVVESGPRTTGFSQQNFRVVGGFRGEVIEGLDYDLFGQFSDTNRTIIQTNQVNLTNLEQSIDVVTDPATGLPICRSELTGASSGCVPFNVFDVNATNEGVGTFLDTPSLNSGAVRQFVFGGTLTADGNAFGIVSPFATSGVQALIGFERREERLDNQADATNQQGLLVGAGGPVLPTDAETELFEVFTELQVPVIQDKPFIKEFTLSGAYRFSTYNSNDFFRDVAGGDVNANTFSVGAAWVPVEDLRLRGQFQRAIRAPNIFELFNPNNTGLVNLQDPCSGFIGTATAPTATAAQCANTGVTAAQFGLIPPDSGQLNTFGGGNINLNPEESDTFTIGAIIQPRQIDGLLVSVDYFNIKVDDFIGTIPPAETLAGCLATGDPVLCSLVTRAANGSLTTDGSFISTNLANIGGLDTSGIDFQVTYGFDPYGLGNVSLNYVSTLLLDLTTQSQPTSAPFDCSGFFDDACGTPNANYRHNLTLSYDAPYDIRISALWRYFSGTTRVSRIVDGDVIPFFEDPNFPNRDPEVRGSVIGGESFIDLAAFYDVNENFELRMGVNNVFDNNVIVDSTVGPADGNVLANVFPAQGRFFFIGAKAKF